MTHILLIRSACMMVLNNAVKQLSLENNLIDILTDNQSVDVIQNPEFYTRIVLYYSKKITPAILKETQIEPLKNTAYDEIIFLINSSSFSLWKYRKVFAFCRLLKGKKIIVMNGHITSKHLPNTGSFYCLAILNSLYTLCIKSYITLVTLFCICIRKLKFSSDSI